jgi:4-hydroxybenzoate polyprenyltransferase
MAATNAWTDYFRQLRPHQWVKNLLVFLPALAAHNFSVPVLTRSFIAFVAFSFCASAGYIINDVVDRDNDRRHSTKRSRPLASGKIQIPHAVVMAVVFLVVGLGVAVGGGILLLVCVGLYFTLALAYSVSLKKHVLIDVFALGLLYTLRVFGGAAATSIKLSPWLLAFSLFLFLALAIVKRYAELAEHMNKGKAGVTGRGYLVGDLPVLASLAAASGFSAVLVLALYVNSPAVAVLYKRPELLWIICLLLAYWIGRILILAHRRQIHADPIVFALTDPISWLTCAGVLAMAIAASLRVL